MDNHENKRETELVKESLLRFEFGRAGGEMQTNNQTETSYPL